MPNNSVKFIKGLGVARYILIRNGLPFLSHISFYKGLRLIAEKAAIKYGNRSYNLTEKEYLAVQNAISKIKDFLRNSTKSWNGLFLYTGWYKDSIVIGCAGDSKKTYFFKIFKNEATALKEYELIEELRPIYGKCFDVPQIILRTESMLVYTFIPRTTSAPVNKVCELLANTAKLWMTNKNTRTDTLAQLIEKFRSTALALNHEDLPKTSIDELSKIVYKHLIPIQPGYPVCMIHGDMTPWNLYATRLNKIALVDSERVAHRMIYTDLLHFYIQPKALQRFSLHSSESFIGYLCQWTDIKTEDARTAVIIYLLEELYIDSQTLSKFKNQKILNRAFLRKLSWLKTLLQKYHHQIAEK